MTHAQLFDLLFGIVILLNLIDLVLTVKALETGKATEGNPIMRWAMSLLGVDGALIAVKWALVVFAHSRLYGQPLEVWQTPMLIMLGAFGFVCLSNKAVLRRIKGR